jgi:hypothetical protein
MSVSIHKVLCVCILQVRGVSGGEKKRVTTGEMLVGNQRFMAMDEISTGEQTHPLPCVATAERGLELRTPCVAQSVICRCSRLACMSCAQAISNQCVLVDLPDASYHIY